MIYTLHAVSIAMTARMQQSSYHTNHGLAVVLIQVLTEGDAFMVAFHDPIDAIGWALHVQLALLEAPWPSELLQQPPAKLETCKDGKLLFRGLRVRMAINTGVPAGIIVRHHPQEPIMQHSHLV